MCAWKHSYRYIIDAGMLLAFDIKRNMYMVELVSRSLTKVTHDGIIYTIAGVASRAFSLLD